MPPAIITPAQAEQILGVARRFGEAYAKHVREKVIPALKRFDEAMWIAYRQAGAPYGDTPDGRLRWVKEHGEQQRARDLAEREEAMRATVEMLRDRRPD